MGNIPQPAILAGICIVDVSPQKEFVSSVSQLGIGIRGQPSGRGHLIPTPIADDWTRSRYRRYQIALPRHSGDTVGD
jgi:hypothetical protein